VAMFKRGNVWWFEFTFQAVRHRESSQSTSKETCRRAMAAKRLALEQNANGIKPVAKPIKCTVAVTEVIEHNKARWEPKTIRMHKNSQTHLNKFFDRLLLSQITPDHIGAYQNKRKAAGASGRSVNIEISLLRLAMKRAKMWAAIADDVRMLRENRDVGKALSPDEETRLLAACKASSSRSLYPAVLLSLHSALRNSELRLLRWRQVDLINATVQVGKSKTQAGEGRVVPLSRDALNVLRGWAAQFPALQPSHYVFPSERYHLNTAKGEYGGKAEVYRTLPDQPIQTFNTSWVTAKKVAGVSCRWHDMRHTAISRLAEAGAMDATIMAYAGHMSGRMKELYSHVRSEQKRLAVARAFDGVPNNPPH
jgi:integrase